MTRLEIAVRLIAAHVAHRGASPDHAVALKWADALIAAELASRPKCEHRQQSRDIGDQAWRCLTCGSEVQP